MSELLAFFYGGIWKQHPAHHGYYFSDQGLAASVSEAGKKISTRLLIGCKSGHGYRAVSYPIGGGKYGRIYIHRAVCELFHGEAPADGLVVRHLDCDMFNNRADNLAWGTPADNAQDAIRNGKIKLGQDNPMARLTKEQAELMREIRSNTGAYYHQIAEQFGVSRMTAYRAINRRLWK